jgi:hypothetical protein
MDATNQKLGIQKHLCELDAYGDFECCREKSISFGIYTKRWDEDTEYEKKVITQEIWHNEGGQFGSSDWTAQTKSISKDAKLI